MSKDLAASLESFGIAHVENFYGGGSHAWSYWQADLAKYLPMMAQAVAHPRPAPPSGPFSYCSILPSFSALGWTFSTDHPVTEVTYLSRVSRYRPGAIGSGSL